MEMTPDSIVYTDSWQGYHALESVRSSIAESTHSKRFTDAQNHINGIENFWN